MPTRTVRLTPDQDAFIEEAVRSGTYRDAEEALRDAVQGLQVKTALDKARLEHLKAHLQAGLDQLDAGECVDVPVDDLEAWLDSLAPARSR
jgi:putative addiction module CopG family antidote